MKITSNAPGNIFTFGDKIDFSIHDVANAIKYKISDYHGKIIADGSADADDMIADITIKNLKPGWYQIFCEDNKSNVSASFGVVMKRDLSVPRRFGRVCADAASSWLVSDPSQRIPFAKMIKLSGIPMVRERLSWDNLVVDDWGRYQDTVDSFADEGIQVFQIWHSTPEQSHPNRKNTYFPDDLRDAYRFSKNVASHFAGKVNAWEPWNEPDIGFWSDLSDKYSAYAKSAYLGLKAGDPNAVLLQSSLCIGVTPFAENIYECGMGDYFNVFNWHSYNLPADYLDQLASYRKLMKKFGLDNRPAWITEAGIRIAGKEGAGKRLLTLDDQSEQCRFIPKSIAMSLAAGNDKHFFFVLPDYLENGVQFGSLKPDLTPYPGFIALSAAANLLGDTTYSGEYKAGDGVHVIVFDSSEGNIAVVWSDNETTLDIPVGDSDVEVLDIFGASSDLSSANGILSMNMTNEPVYIRNIGKEISSKLVNRTPIKSVLPNLNPSKIVIAGYADLNIDKTKDIYIINNSDKLNSDGSFDYHVDMYNFDESKPAKGSVNISIPAGWISDKSSFDAEIEPMGRLSSTIRVTPKLTGLQISKIKINADFDGEKAAPSQSSFRNDVLSVIPAAKFHPNWMDAGKWQPDSSENGKVSISDLPDTDCLRLDVSFSGEGDRWAYPYMRISDDVDLSEYDAFLFDLETDVSDADTTIGVMLAEDNGAHYYYQLPTFKEKKKVYVMFEDMVLLSFMKLDPNNKLDLDKVTDLKIGCNTVKFDDIKILIEKPELVKF